MPDRLVIPPPIARSSIARVSRGRARAAIGLSLAAVLAGAAPPARCQQDTVYAEQGRTSRAKTLGALGALVGGLAGFAIGSTQKPPSYSIAAAGLVIGGVAGWLVGRQTDELHAAQFHGVRPIMPHSTMIEIEGDPLALAVHDSVVAVGGSEDVQIFLSANSLIPRGARARSLLGISAVEIVPRSEWLAVGTANGLYLFPPTRGRGLLVSPGSVAAVVATPGRVFSASGDRVTMTPVEADSAGPWPGISLGAPVRSLALDGERAIIWAVTDERLVAIQVVGDSLLPLGAATIEGGARRVAVLKNRVAVAVGERGVRLFDVSDPTQPRAGRPWTVARFAYDVSLDGSRMFVAAGPEGVYVVEFRKGAMVTIGVARGLGFASAIVSRDGYTYLLDGRTNSLRRLDSEF